LGVRRQRRERQQVEPVVQQDGLEHRGTAATDELEVPGRNLESTDVADPPDAKHRLLEVRQPARPIALLGHAPQPPRRVQHVEVRQRAHHLRHALHLAAHFHHRHVEGAPVVRHQHRIVAEVGVERVQEGAFGGKGREQELCGAEAVGSPLPHTGQECHHAGAAAQACRLEVEVHQPRRTQWQRIGSHGTTQ
jgi:hypothetical protein